MKAFTRTLRRTSESPPHSDTGVLFHGSQPVENILPPSPLKPDESALNLILRDVFSNATADEHSTDQTEYSLSSPKLSPTGVLVPPVSLNRTSSGGSRWVDTPMESTTISSIDSSRRTSFECRSVSLLPRRPSVQEVTLLNDGASLYTFSWWQEDVEQNVVEKLLDQLEVEGVVDERSSDSFGGGQSPLKFKICLHGEVVRIDFKQLEGVTCTCSGVCCMWKAYLDHLGSELTTHSARLQHSLVDYVGYSREMSDPDDTFSSATHVPFHLGTVQRPTVFDCIGTESVTYDTFAAVCGAAYGAALLQVMESPGGVDIRKATYTTESVPPFPIVNARLCIFTCPSIQRKIAALFLGQLESKIAKERIERPCPESSLVSLVSAWAHGTLRWGSVLTELEFGSEGSPVSQCESTTSHEASPDSVFACASKDIAENGCSSSAPREHLGSGLHCTTELSASPLLAVPVTAAASFSALPVATQNDFCSSIAAMVKDDVPYVTCAKSSKCASDKAPSPCMMFRVEKVFSIVIATGGKHASGKGRSVAERRDSGTIAGSSTSRKKCVKNHAGPGSLSKRGNDREMVISSRYCCNFSANASKEFFDTWVDAMAGSSSTIMLTTRLLLYANITAVLLHMCTKEMLRWRLIPNIALCDSQALAETISTLKLKAMNSSADGSSEAYAAPLMDFEWAYICDKFKAGMRSFLVSMYHKVMGRSDLHTPLNEETELRVTASVSPVLPLQNERSGLMRFKEPLNFFDAIAGITPERVQAVITEEIASAASTNDESTNAVDIDQGLLGNSSSIPTNSTSNQTVVDADENMSEASI